MTMLCRRSECTGCGACLNVCPMGCIDMRPDAEGFLFPGIDIERCNQCGQCHNACPILFKPGIERGDSPDVYACWNLDDKVRMESSSGGMFSVFADYVLENNGIVYGALLDDSQRLLHSAIFSKDELSGVRKSKYIQSDIKDTYCEAKEHLNSERIVLFTGTPCQIAGLYGFLGNKRYPKLITADIVCHGVPSPLVFKKYQQYLETKYKSQIKEISFRDKKNGWLEPDVLIGFKNEKQRRQQFITQDLYSRAFLANICLRESCYCCHFTTSRRYGDITLADFWGIGQLEPFAHDTNKGVSLVMINSEIGRQIFNSNSNQFFSERRELVEAINGNINLQHPTKRHLDRNGFFESLHLLEFKVLVNKYVPVSTGFRVFVKKMLGRKLVKYIRAVTSKTSK